MNRDDAAVYDIGGTGIISTTDCYAVVDGKYEDFGRIAATKNAISDGMLFWAASPIMAVRSRLAGATQAPSRWHRK